MSKADTRQIYETAARHHAEGRAADAEAGYRAVLAADPAHAPALNALGTLLASTGRPGEGADLIAAAVRVNPREAGYLLNQGIVLGEMGRPAEAADALRKALSLSSDLAEAALHLGYALHDLAKPGDAVDVWRRLAALRPDDPQPQYALGTALRECGRSGEAIEHFRRALAQRPDLPEAANNLGLALRDCGQLDGAIDAHRAALAMRPESADVLNNLGIVLTETGQFDDGLACYRRAVAAGAGPQAYSNLLYSLYFNPRFNAHAIVSEHRRWDESMARPLAPQRPKFDNDPSPDRRLRVGYVSPNFRNHVVGRFLLPLFAHHDRTAFELVCYDDGRAADDVTHRLAADANLWRQTAKMSDEQLAAQIRQDRIDILVDLNMHMEGSRLLAFARRPAPVQITYLAYAGTTGLAAMDYRLTDAHLDPPGGDESIYTERSVRLPRTYWCYPPPAEAPDVAPLPASVAGYVTFGCLNVFSKINAAVIEVWAAILRATPDSRLIVHAPHGSHRDTLLSRFSSAGVEAGRVEFVGRVAGAEYFAQYRRIDLALDPFPYPGGTTTCDALWMGVPVVTLAGASAIARAGVSLLTNVGLEGMIATSSDQYVRIATDLAADLSRLTSLRAKLRGMMSRSPLTDSPRFARDVEAAYRDTWAAWCRRPGGAG